MADAGVDPVAIDVFAHYFRLLEHGETGMIPESAIDPLDMESLADVDVPDDVAAEALADHRGDQAQRRPRHVDGHGPRQVAALRAPRPVLPRHHRPAGAAPPREVRRPAAADLHEQLPHLATTRWPRWPATTDLAGRRAAAGVPAEQGAQAAGQGPRAGDVAQGPRPRVVPARPRRPLHRAARHRPARPADRRRATARRSSPTPTTSAPSRTPRVAGWFAASRCAVRDRGRPPYPHRPKGGHFARRKSDGRIVLRETAQTLPEDLDALADLERHRFSQHQQPLVRPARRCATPSRPARACSGCR